MVVDYFLKCGDYKGGSVDDAHKNEIDIIDWGWGMEQSGTTHMGPGAGAGKVDVHDMRFTKYVDKASPNLMVACCKGTHIPECVLTVRKAGDKPLEYLIITMTDCLVSLMSTGGNEDEALIKETLNLNFAHVKVVYTPQKKDGSGDAALEMTWNIATNTE